MRILAAGDYHIHNYPQFARPWQEGLNSRVSHILQALYQIPKLIVEQKIDVFCSLGDWNFNASNDYRLERVTRAFSQQCIAAVEKNGGIAIGIHGNHDTVSGDEDNHNNYPYMSNTISGQQLYKGVWFHCIGYNTKLPDVDSLPNYQGKFHVFLLHKDIVGGRTTQGFVYKSEGAVSPAYFAAVKKKLKGKVIFLNGHYHSPQTLGNVICVGSPVQHNRGDAGDTRGVYCVQLPSLKSKRFYLHGPRFFDFLWSDIAKGRKYANFDWAAKGTYVTIIARDDIEYRSAGDFKKKNPGNIRLLLQRDEKQTLTKGGHQQSTLMSEDDLLKKYLVEKEGKTAAQADRLVKLNKRLQTQ